MDGKNSNNDFGAEDKKQMEEDKKKVAA